MKSLTARFMLWNGAFVFLILLGFGLALFLASQRAVEGMVDRELVSRALQVAREASRPEPPFGFGDGRPPPNPPREDQGVGRPRLFNHDGTERQPNDNPGMWSRKLFDQSLRGKVILETQWADSREVRVVSAPIPGQDKAMGVVQIGQEMAPYRLAQRAQLWVLTVAIPLSLLVAGLLGLLLARMVLRPVRSLTLAAERIAADPVREEQIEVVQHDEIGRLATAFNAMIGRLQDSNRELAELLEQQRRFTSDAAHEFRTPLTGIVLAAENGLDERATPEEMRASLQTALKNGQAMSSLTQLLLTLARLDHSQARLELTEVPVLPIIHAALTEANLDADPRLQVSAEGTLTCNADALRQIVRNLIENAAAHTPAGGAIYIRFEANVLQISDTGSGIAPEHVPHLFDRFYRVDAARQRGSGVGLGLAIVKTLAERQGASVAVVSKVGQGTTFRVSFAKKPETSPDSHD